MQMRCATVAIFVLLGLGALADEAVITLDSTNFDSTIATNPHILVEFYAPWCGHCKKLAPEYEEAAQQLKSKNIPLAKVDCTTEKDLCGRFGVQGFPTVKWFDSGKPTDYQDQRNAKAIVGFVTKRTGPASTSIASADELKSFKASNPTFVLGVVTGADADVFVEFAKTHRDDFVFAHTADASLAGVTVQAPGVVLFASFLETPLAYNGEFTTAGIDAFLKAESFPLVTEISGDNYMKFIERKLPLLWIFVEEKEMKAKQADWGATLKTALEVAPEFKGKVSFVYLDGVKFERHKENMGIVGGLPAVIIEDISSSAPKKFLFTGSEITAESLKAYLSSFVKGELKPYLKSEAVPETNDGPVKVLVGSTFEQIAFDETKDVLVEFYAPWCGHCKSLAPIYDQLGEAFAKEESVIIAKIDATANDTPEAIRGFPTLIFYPAGGEKVTYEGARDLESLEAFVKKTAKTLTKTVTEATGAETKDEL